MRIAPDYADAMFNQNRGSCRLLAPPSCQRLPIGMGCTGAPITEILRDAGPFDGSCFDVGNFLSRLGSSTVAVIAIAAS
jgi:hypothetical protein